LPLAPSPFHPCLPFLPSASATPAPSTKTRATTLAIALSTP
jgi:hypothetical protein